MWCHHNPIWRIGGRTKPKRVSSHPNLRNLRIEKSTLVYIPASRGPKRIMAPQHEWWSALSTTNAAILTSIRSSTPISTSYAFQIFYWRGCLGCKVLEHQNVSRQATIRRGFFKILWLRKAQITCCSAILRITYSTITSLELFGLICGM